VVKAQANVPLTQPVSRVIFSSFSSV